MDLNDNNNNIMEASDPDVHFNFLCKCVNVMVDLVVFKFGYYYIHYLIVGFVYCVATCFVSPEYDVTQVIYIKSLFSIFHWAAKFSAISATGGDNSSDRVTYVRQNSRLSEDHDAVQLKTSKTKYSTEPSLIHRDAIEVLRHKLRTPSADDRKRSYLEIIVEDVNDYITAGVEAVVDDEFGSSFQVPELSCWNLLSRTKGSFAVLSTRLKIIWFFGFFFRFIFLVPVRLMLLVFCFSFVGMGAIYFTFFPAYLDSYHRSLAEWFIRVSYRLMGRAASCIAIHHQPEHHPLYGGLCVSNHTSPIDIIPLNFLKAYSLTGQKHSGMIGYFESTLHKIVPCLWFERSSVKDRKDVKNKLLEHISNPNNPPILIFPEGVCVNNTTTIQFKKGSFEVTDIVYPIAMKFDLRFGDPFWHQDSWNAHLWAMLTSWAIVVDVFYLQAMHKGVVFLNPNSMLLNRACETKSRYSKSDSKKKWLYTHFPDDEICSSLTVLSGGLFIAFRLSIMAMFGNLDPQTKQEMDVMVFVHNLVEKIRIRGVSINVRVLEHVYAILNVWKSSLVDKTEGIDSSCLVCKSPRNPVFPYHIVCNGCMDKAADEVKQSIL